MRSKIRDWAVTFNKRKPKVVNILSIFILLWTITIIPLKYDLQVDTEHFDGTHQWLTASSLKFIDNWLKDGAIKDKFVMYEDFASIEFEKKNRAAYVSYPPGAVLPLFIIEKLVGKKQSSITFVKHFVQFEFYLSILFFGLLIYMCLEFLEVNSRLLKIVLPVIFSSLWAYLPFNYYYMRNVYLSDQAVILLSIIFFVIEVALINYKLKKWRIVLHFLSCAVLFLGILTDYYFCFIAFVSIIYRIFIAFEEYPTKAILYRLLVKTWAMIATIVLCTLLFMYQIHIIPNGLKLLKWKFFFRTSSGQDFGGLHVLIKHFNDGFSFLFLPLLIFVVVYCVLFLFKRNYNVKVRMIVHWLSLIVLSAVMHTIALRNHSIIHEFSMLKYNLVFVFIIFSFLCWVYVYYEKWLLDGIKGLSNIKVTLAGGLVLCCATSLKDFDKVFYQNRIDKEDYSIANFIGENTNYYDVVYSPDYVIDINPPMDLAISKKRIYRISSMKDIDCKNLADNAIINILISKETMKDKAWVSLYKVNDISEKLENYCLFKFTKGTFQSLMDENSPSN